MTKVEFTIELAKTQILADIKEGLIPSNVSSFAELHDYVDANEYGSPDIFELLDVTKLDSDFENYTDEAFKDVNAVQDALDAWLANGRK